MNINPKTLKAGDKVRAIRDFFISSSDQIKKGTVYTVKTVDKTTDSFKMIEVPFSYSFDYFDLVSRSFKRDNRGRFANKQSLKRPVALKKGALYGVQRKRGRVIAHLRNTVPVGKETYGVFTGQNKRPFLAKISKVTLAGTDEVRNYLQNH